MVTKLELYNIALGHLGPVRLGASGLTENRPDRKELDAVYDRVVDGMLEKGIWFFALRTQQWTPDTGVSPLFGLPYAYPFPSDYKRLRHICIDPDQRVEDRSFKREAGYIRSRYSTLYVTFVSKDASYGLNLGAWPTLFTEAVGAELAYASGLPITKDHATKNNLFALKKNALSEARRVDAVDERVKEKPLSSWALSRRGSSSDQRRDPSSTGQGNGT